MAQDHTQYPGEQDGQLYPGFDPAAGKSEETNAKGQGGGDSPQSNQRSETLTGEEQRLKAEDGIPKKLDDIERVLEEKVGLNTSFDLIFRRMEFGGKTTAFLYTNGFVKDEVVVLIMTRLSQLDKEQVGTKAVHNLMDKYIPHVQVTKTESMDKAVD